MSPESAKAQNVKTRRCLVLASGASDHGAGDWWERGLEGTGGGWVYGEKLERKSLSVKLTVGVQE